MKELNMNLPLVIAISCGLCLSVFLTGVAAKRVVYDHMEIPKFLWCLFLGYVSFGLWLYALLKAVNCD